MLVSPQLWTLPQISTPTSSWRRDAATGNVVYSAPAVNSSVLVTGGPAPGSVDWLHHSSCFGYAAPSDAQEALVEEAFRRCRYDCRCAADTLWEGLGAEPSPTAVDAHEELLAWWSRRCWEDRRSREAAEAAGRSPDPLARGFTLAGWCRFATTARRAAHQACAASGGNSDLLRSWRRCRVARGRPSEAAAAAVEALGLGGADGAETLLEGCCGDARCLARALQGTDGDAELARRTWSLANERFGSLASGRKR